MQKSYDDFIKLFPESTKFYCSCGQKPKNEMIITYDKGDNICDLLSEYPSHQYASIGLVPDAKYTIYTNKKFGMICDSVHRLEFFDVDENMMNKIITKECTKFIKKINQNSSYSWERTLVFDREKLKEMDNFYFAQLTNDPKIKTFNLCKNIVVSYYFLIEYVPREFLNDDFFEYCRSKMPDKEYHSMLYMLIKSKNDINLAMCNAIIHDVCSYYTWQLNLFDFIPESYLTEDYLINAIKNAHVEKSKENFKSFVCAISKCLITKNLMTKNIQKCIDTLNSKKQIKEKTKEDYFEEIKKNPNNIENVPTNMVTIEMCNYILSSGKFINFEHYPNEILNLDEEKIISCMKKFKFHYTGTYLEHIPECFKTEKVCKLAIDYNASNFKYTPLSLRTKEMCDYAYARSKHYEKEYIYKMFPPDIQILYDNGDKPQKCTIM